MCKAALSLGDYPFRLRMPVDRNDAIRVASAWAIASMRLWM